MSGSANTPRNIGLLAFDGMAALDLAGVQEAFSIADGGDWRQARRRYAPLTIGLTPQPVVCESGLRILPDTALEQAPCLDTLVVPGGPGLRLPPANATVAAWLRQHGGGIRRIVSVCTGLYGLAASGLLDGRRATTHWAHAADAARRFPRVTIEPDAIFIKDGKFYSSAGMTAGIDLALALIEEDHGPALALKTARQLVVHMKRSGGQLQYSEPLRAQMRGGDRFADLVAQMSGDLARAWSVETMAAQTGLSPRQFSRRFKQAFALTPGAWLDILRLDEARLLLASGTAAIAQVAASVGFHSDDAFRRAFERRFGLAPTAYRARFSAAAHKESLHDLAPPH